VTRQPSSCCYTATSRRSSVCERLLRRQHDVEDAAQATFLALASAGSFDRSPRSRTWLCRAYRAELCVRADSAQYPTVDPQAIALPTADAGDDLMWRELRPKLAEEVGRLSRRLREASVLCHIQASTNEQAAHESGCPRANGF
jgi:DNA-directed RNA polymerase specialized sigma24 family protein